MKKSAIFLALAFAVLPGGCSIFGIRGNEIIMPVAVEKTVLPPAPAAVPKGSLFLKTRLLITKRGAVKQVQLINSSGDPDWDSAAAAAITHWKYSPGLEGGKPIEMSVIQVMHVISTPPRLVHLMQMWFSSESEADSVLAMLRSGSSFDSLAAIHSLRDSVLRSGDMGSVNIHLFPRNIQRQLVNLKPRSFTSVLPLGPYYVIFERVT